MATVKSQCHSFLISSPSTHRTAPYDIPARLITLLLLGDFNRKDIYHEDALISRQHELHLSLYRAICALLWLQQSQPHRVYVTQFPASPHSCPLSSAGNLHHQIKININATGKTHEKQDWQWKFGWPPDIRWPAAPRTSAPAVFFFFFLTDPASFRPCPNFFFSLITSRIIDIWE